MDTTYLAHVVFCLFILIGSHLVDNDTRNADIVMLAENAIQFQFIKRTSQTSIGDQNHIGSNHGRNFCIVDT